MEKLCRACGSTKPVSDFHKDRSKADGLNAYCKPCHVARQRAFDMRPPRHQAPEGMKRCQRCKETKTKDSFYAQQTTYDGLRKVCIECARVRHEEWRKKNLARLAADQKRRRKADPERWHEYGLKKSYRLERGDFARMLAAQNGRCAICGTDKPVGKSNRFHVDHCHDTEIVRGLLCHHCNLGLGHFFHRLDFLRAAIDYLSRTKS